MTLPDATIEKQELRDAESRRLDPQGSAAYGRRTFRQRVRRIPWHLAVFIIPAFVVYTTFMVCPLVDSLRLSLFSEAGKFVGLRQLPHALHRHELRRTPSGTPSRTTSSSSRSTRSCRTRSRCCSRCCSPCRACAGSRSTGR